MGHRPAAAKLVEQTAGPSALPKLVRMLLVLVELHPRAAGLREGLEKRLRPLQVVERDVAGAAAGDRDEDLRHPVGMRRTAGDVDHGQAPLALEVRPQESAPIAFQVLQADAVGGVGRRGGNAAPAGAVAEGHDGIGHAAELRHPILHRPIGEHVEPAGAMRGTNHRALEDEDVERPFARHDVGEHRLHMIAHLHAQRGMPEHVDAEIRDEVTGTRLLGVQKRHRVAAAGPALQPEKCCHGRTPAS